MAQMSDYLENALANHVFRSTTMASPGLVYIALFSTDPGEDNSGTELAGNGYTRKQITFTVPSNGMISNNIEVSFPVASSDWNQATHIGILDDSVGGNLLMSKILTTPVTVLSGNNLRLAVGDLDLTFA